MPLSGSRTPYLSSYYRQSALSRFSELSDAAHVYGGVVPFKFTPKYRSRFVNIMSKRIETTVPRMSRKVLSSQFMKFVGRRALGGGWSKAARGGMAAAFGIGVFGVTLGKSMMSNLRWASDAEKVQTGAGYGPGYITWSKKSGMPANHLGAQDMMDSLHRMRHTSIL